MSSRLSVAKNDSATVMKRRIGLVEGRPVETAAVRGSVATGDVFAQDDEGYLTFVGRRADFIVRNGEKICLAAVRRLAENLPYVHGAHTVVEQGPEGKDDYIVELRTALPAEPSEEDYARMLRRWLRQAEMPRAILDDYHRYRLCWRNVMPRREIRLFRVAEHSPQRVRW